MRNSRHLRCTGQHTSERSSSCVFVQKSSPSGENSGAESGGLWDYEGFEPGIARCRLALSL